MLMLLVLLADCIFAQSDSQTTRSLAHKLNFGPVWMHTDNSSVLGFIGPNYQRIRLKFLTITKDTNDPRLYHVTGKSKVKENICRFSGTILITELAAHEPSNFGLDDEYKDSGMVTQGTLEGTYHFAEDSTQPQSGVFQGTLSTSWYIDRHHRLRYDDIEASFSDSFTNNQFRGTWEDYRAKKSKVCNWGDFRIPDCGDLDIGAGYFSPDEKYAKYGWQSRRDANTYPPDPNARRQEEAAWWR